jgi:intracellular multiplication protein IcmB
LRGSGKSVLSNAINLGLCLSAGLQRLPRIAIIDIGPSSSGLISLLKEALPQNQRHFVAYHRLRMTPDYSINPFDTQLGCRFPTPQERGFLVNFVTLLTTPVGAAMPYDGISDMAGMVVDELYKNLADSGNPYQYTQGIEPLVDGILEEIGFVQDQKTTWWEVVDALFIAGFTHEAGLAQRYAMPLVADGASICRSQTVEDLYGKIIAPTGETLINAFARMISSAVREYPVLSRVTTFDLGEAKIVSLDLDEVAKGGGDAADRQTAVMYMLARYILAKTYYLTEDNVTDMPEQYREYHRKRIGEIREDPKRLVMDEFHRTSKARAVRDQVIIDMREGRKWKVHIALISQSLDDFDETMVEFATGIYIMDAGPQQSVEKSAKIFGLSETAQIALRTRVHGPREGGGTFLVQYATKGGINLQLVTSTLGPIELWSFSTTVEDALLRNQLYKRIGPKEARRVLSTLFPSGSVAKLVEEKLNNMKEKQQGLIAETANLGVIDELVEQILLAYRDNPNFKSLPLKN